MGRMTSRFSTLVFASFCISACVSVSIGPGKPVAAKNVRYKEPPPPYAQFTSEEIDAGWKNATAGTSISYKSSCGESLDLPLESIQQSMLYGIDNVKILKSQKLPYNEREALNSIVEGKVDGVDTKMQLLILKKNRCTYMISYVALKKSFEKDQKNFQNFLNHFEAP